MQQQLRNVKVAPSYASAALMFDAARPRRTLAGKSGTHFLPGHETGFTGISRTENGDIVFTYHLTDVVTWHPDNSLTLDLSYRSLSTATFANRFCPNRQVAVGSVDVYSEGSYIIVNGRYYVPRDRVHIASGREGPHLTNPARDTIPLRKMRLDRKATKAVLAKTGYAAFREWYLLSAAMLGPNQRHLDYKVVVHDIPAALEDREQYMLLLKTAQFGLKLTPEIFLSHIRDHLYRGHDVHVTETYEYVTSWESYRACRR